MVVDVIGIFWGDGVFVSEYVVKSSFATPEVAVPGMV